MFDLHTHILPGIDDGATTIAEAVAMARAAVADGIGGVAATPHLRTREPIPDLAAAIAATRDALAREQVPLAIFSGAEIFVSPDVPDRLADGTLPTLNGTRYALIELGFEILPPNLDRLLFELQVAGFIPVLAHVERYRFVQRHAELIDEWCDRGAILQLTAGSFRGDFGQSSQRVAAMIAARSLPTIVASDGHHARTRRLEMSFARELIVTHAGAARATDLLDAGPAAIVAGQPFPAPSPGPADDDRDDDSGEVNGLAAAVARARHTVRRLFGHDG